MEFAKKIDEKRKNDFLEKQELFERARDEQMRKAEEERQLHAQELLLQEQRRSMMYA